MKHKELEEVVAGEADSLRKYAERILSADDAEDIHRFRVGYKKLRAFLRLHTGKAKGLSGELKQIYRAAGEVRDRQVHLAIILDWLEHDGREVAGYPGILKAELEESRNKLNNLIIGYPFRGLTEKLTKSLPDQLSHDTITRFVRRQAEGFYENIEDGATDEALHTARKHLKDLVYNAGYLRADKMEQSFLEQHKTIKKLASLLGDYHDKHALIARLQAVQEGEIAANEQESLLRLQEKLNLEKLELKTTIRKASQNLLDKAGKSAIATATQAGLLVGSAIVAGLAVFFLNYINRRGI